MTNKFLSNFVILSTIFSCSNPKNFPAAKEDDIDFSADPNNFDHFEKNFEALVNFVSRSTKKNSDIGPSQVKKCIKYIARYKGLEDFYERSQKDQFLKEPFEDLICILASYHGEILKRYGNEMLKEIVDKVYTQKIFDMKKIEERKDKDNKDVILRTTSELIDELEIFVNDNLQNLMARRPDVAFLYATAVAYNLTLSEILLQENSLREQVNSDKSDNPEILKNLFAQELSFKDHPYFSEEICKGEKKSQFKILIDNFENHFSKRYPCISFEKDIRRYLQDDYKDDVERNMVECVKEFFKKNYQKYKIQFSECSLSLLAKYLKSFDQIDVEKKKNLGEILVLYLLSFKSNSLQRNNFVFEDMGSAMFVSKTFTPEQQAAHNESIKTIIDFIEANYNEMEEKLFKETTGKKTKDGNKKIIEELKHQLELGKRF